MKKTVAFMSFVLFFNSFGYAQEIKRCSSAEYLMELEKNDPAFAKRRMQSEVASQQWINSHAGGTQRTIITIPVVFHLLYNDSSQLLNDAVIQSQMDVINEDYRRTNADSGQTPLAFRAVAADCEIEFCLAKRTPSNQPTNGIIRKFTSVPAFTSFEDPKFNITGGDDGWDASRYLNVWVAAFTSQNFLGLGTFPGGDPQRDGVVINYKVCGRVGSHLMTHYNKGRSLTHEIGHWLSLAHVWGDDGNTCSSDDFISDTPIQATETYGCPAYPKTDFCTSSFPGIMFMNFMDYTDDGCMNIFTDGQKARMLAALNNDRTSILSSDGCVSVGIEDNGLKNFISVFPNPTEDKLYITSNDQTPLDAVISVLNISGETVLKELPLRSVLNTYTGIDISALSRGVYFLKLHTDKGDAMYKVVKQ